YYLETGLLTVYAGVNPKKAEDAAEAVKSVIEDFKKNGLSEEEFLRGREQLKSSTIFSQENTSSQMLLYGKQLLYTGEVYDFESRMNEISALTRDDVMKCIQSGFDFNRVAVASVGNLKKAIQIK
ncbi:MAG: insulinase family protein, partial [Clostridiales bacterium]|nr:insulinase family protein [Clostridiales bacterium]